jgi:hypothetical protein
MQQKTTDLFPRLMGVTFSTFQARYQAEDRGTEERIRFTPKRPAAPADPEGIGG